MSQMAHAHPFLRAPTLPSPTSFIPPTPRKNDFLSNKQAACTQAVLPASINSTQPPFFLFVVLSPLAEPQVQKAGIQALPCSECFLALLFYFLTPFKPLLFCSPLPIGSLSTLLYKPGRSVIVSHSLVFFISLSNGKGPANARPAFHHRTVGPWSLELL